MEIRGVETDRKKVTTRPTVNLQGFGAWEESFEFPFLSRATAGCAQLYVEITHDKVGVVAANAFPIQTLRLGSGELRLLEPALLCQAKTAACLVCHLAIREAKLTKEEFIAVSRKHSAEDQVASENFGI